MSSSAAPSEKEIRILIADDHPVVREGLIAILALESDMKVIGQARDGEEACRLYQQLSPRHSHARSADAKEGWP